MVVAGEVILEPHEVAYWTRAAREEGPEAAAELDWWADRWEAQPDPAIRARSRSDIEAARSAANKLRAAAVLSGLALPAEAN